MNDETLPEFVVPSGAKMYCSDAVLRDLFDGEENINWELVKRLVDEDGEKLCWEVTIP